MSSPSPPLIDVGAGAAVEAVGGALPVRVLARPLPMPLIAADAGEDQVLDLVLEIVAERGIDRVGAAAGRFDDDVEAVVDDVGVVAEAAAHGVGAGAAVELVGALNCR